MSTAAAVTRRGPDDLRLARRRMVEQLASGKHAIGDAQVLRALRAVPRHIFVEGQHVKKQAYGDFALPIGHRQTISQPWVVARMTELLQLDRDHKVLEIGTGSGYQTAILARLSRFVFSMERIGALSREAIGRMRTLGIDNVKIQAFDGTVGWGAMAPFDRILVTAATPSPIPKPLIDQLGEGGVLVVPEGDRDRQSLMRYTKTDGTVRGERFETVVFVPLLGRYGWDEDE